MEMGSERLYDLVLLGATGYTGALTAKYIADYLPTSLKWAIAGRSMPKLEKLAKELSAIDASRLQPAIEVVHLNRAELVRMMRKSKVCINLVGPYPRYGELVIGACIASQTHYLDTSGDLSWLGKMIEKYEDPAKKSGTLLISAVGNFSAPQDLLTWTLVSELRRQTSRDTKEVVLSVCEMSSQPSGGSLLSIFDNFESPDAKAREDAKKPWHLSPVQGQRTSNSANVLGMRHDAVLGPLSAHSISAEQNRAIVHRSWGLLDGGVQYGQNFQYNEFVKAGTLVGVVAQFSIAALSKVLSFGLMRNFVKRFVHAPGEGPDTEATKKTRIELQAVAIADQDAEEPARAFGKLTFAGGPYHITGLYLAQGAATILNNPDMVKSIRGGFITPAVLGQAFVDSAEAGGVHIEANIL